MSDRRLSGTSCELRGLPETIVTRIRGSRANRQPRSFRVRLAFALAVAGICSLFPDAAGCFCLLTGSAKAQSEPTSKTSEAARALMIDSQPDDLALKQLSSTGSIRWFPDFPLYHALPTLAREHEVAIVIDNDAFDEARVPGYEPLNPPHLGVSADGGNAFPFWTSNPTLAQLLDVVLDEPELSWYVSDGVITVTTIEAQRKHLFPRSYDADAMRRHGVSPKTLIQTLQKHTNADWAETNEAGGRISLVGNVLTVWQTYQAHRQVRGLLLKLADPGGAPWVEYPEEKRRLAAVLRKPTKVNYPRGVTLKNFLEDMSRDSAIPIAIDEFAINDAGVWSSEQIFVPAVASIPLDAVLRLAFNGKNLTLILRNGVPTVTSLDDANDPGNFPVAVYDVRKLPGTGLKGSDLLDAVRAIAGAKWESDDQPGGRMTLTENSLLVVSQSDQVHRTLQRLLATWEAGNQ